MSLWNLLPQAAVVARLMGVYKAEIDRFQPRIGQRPGTIQCLNVITAYRRQICMDCLRILMLTRSKIHAVCWLAPNVKEKADRSLMTPEAATNQLTIIDHVQHNDSGTNPDQHSEIKHDSSNLISVDVENDANLSCQGKISDPKQQLKMRWFVRVKYDFQGQTSKELPVKKGDIVFIHRLRDDNWYEGECNGKSGLLPVCYVEPISDLQPHKDTIDEIAIAKFRFTALTNIELPLEKNQTVILLQRIDENWYEGKYPGTNRKGIFPVTYVEIIGKPPDDLICQQELRAYVSDLKIEMTSQRSLHQRHPRRLSYENNESGEQMVMDSSSDKEILLLLCDDEWYLGMLLL
ncbi:sorbin and SH3 domain-containing protein 2-like [Narcine bancroftii]|uniref:sorbin and SH3 domain-containing protein 2-like n=1 Tax=Narcine bancroftii TaxID=1343680 RepID=UPI003831A0FF